MMRKSLAPKNFNDLYGESVFFEIAAKDGYELLPLFSRSCYDLHEDGTIRYYCAHTDGSFRCAQKGSGEFLKLTCNDGSVAFLHYSQIFQLPEKARMCMNPQSAFLGISFQLFRRHLAIINDLLRETLMINGEMNELRSIYNALGMFYGNFNNCAKDELSEFRSISHRVLERVLAMGLELPRKIFPISLIPKLYLERDVVWENCVGSNYLYTFTWFFIGPNKGEKIDRVVIYEKQFSVTIGEAMRGGPAIPNFCEDEYEKFLESYFSVFAMDDYFTSRGTIKFQLGNYFWGTSSKEYWKVDFDDKGNALYQKNREDFFDEQNCPLQIGQKVKSYIDGNVSEIIGGRKCFFVKSHDIVEILEIIRIQLDWLSHRLASLTVVVKAHLGEFQENYFTATQCLVSIGNMQAMNLKNLR